MLDPLSGRKANGAVMTPPVEAASDSLVRTATAADAERCLDVLTLAFENDPPCRWIWSGRQQYLEAFPRFARAFAGDAFDLGTAHYYEGVAGAAFWLPPGTSPDGESVVQIIRETITDERKEAVFSIFEQMDAYHPREPHWHLPLIGVNPASQGRGIGSVLLRYALDRCDREQEAAYLEATSPRNVALYQQHGFETLGAIQVADCPPIVPMLREPR